MLDRFTTANLAPAHRHDAWVNRGGPGIGRLLESRPDGAFDMWSEYLALGTVGVSFGAMSAQSYERTRDRSRRDQVDSVVFCLMLEGEMRGDAADRTFAAGPQSLAFLDLAQAGRHYSTVSRTVMITLPRDTALARFGPLHALHGAVADGGSTRLLRTHLAALHEEAANGLDPKVGATLEQSVLSLLEVTLAMAGEVEEASRAAQADAVKLSAIDEIQRRLDWSGLNTDYLCGRLGVSRTSLYRLFEHDGGVHAYIRQARLERVHAAVTNPAVADSIGELAVRWQFSDTAHLSRLFRATYGASPNALRHDSAND